jgi:hypothetical protein
MKRPSGGLEFGLLIASGLLGVYLLGAVWFGTYALINDDWYFLFVPQKVSAAAHFLYGPIFGLMPNP